MNPKDKFILAIIMVDSDRYEGPYEIKEPFHAEPGFEMASINYDLSKLLSKAVSPEQNP